MSEDCTPQTEYKPGDLIVVTVREDRWWMTLWNWLTFREAKPRKRVFKCVEVISGDCYDPR